MLFLLLTGLAALAAATTVSVNIPIEDQLPMTARVDKLYSWTFFQNTFLSNNNASLFYAAASLPDWLTFDAASRTFSGTPSDSDEGHPEIAVSAKDSSSSASASSTFSFCVSKSSAPTINIPIAEQFKASNPAMSSVFVLSSDSALVSLNPVLRIPPAWSFSIGIESDTFTGSGANHYAALQADGSPLPSWINFDIKTITFNGYTPSIHPNDGPLTTKVVIYAVDSDGYSSAATPFDVVVAAHELRSTHSLPTINITASTQFSTSLNSAFDFSGVLVDKEPIQSSNISALIIDVSQYKDWLHYDGSSRQLSGTPPDNMGVGAMLSSLPVSITAEFNQTIQTSVSIAIVPSYFTAETLPGLSIKAGQDVNFSLIEYISKPENPTDVDLSAAFDPVSAGQYLHFDTATNKLSGSLPQSVDYADVKVTFAAFSRFTHSTSHTSLDMSVAGKNNHTLDPTGFPSRTKSQLILGVGIAFGVVGGLFMLLVFLALCRRWARVADSALEGEAGRQGWTEEEKRWYNLEGEVDEEKMVVNFRNGPDAGIRKYGSLGLGKKPFRTPSNSRSELAADNVQSPVMKKAEFMAKIKMTVRAVSDRCHSVRDRVKVERPRLVIGRPVLLSEERGRMGGEFTATDIGKAIHSDEPANLNVGESPSSSTQATSIPTQRADFAPPSRSPLSGPQTDALSHTQLSADSLTSSPRSFSSRSSMEIHANEAIVQTARAMSVRSGKSVNFPYPPQTVPVGPSGNPRLVPFTKSNRVPVPQVPSRKSSDFNPELDDNSSFKRVMSLSVEVEDKVHREDDLSTAMNYVRAFGSDPIEKEPRSFYSLESSHGSAITYSGTNAPRFLARVGERFAFTLCVTETDRPEVRLASGEALPGFFRVNVRGGNAKGTVQVWGTPQLDDIGEIDIGAYDREDGHCIGRAIAEVVGRA